MAALTYSQEIGAPIETVFELVDYGENLKLWMDGVEETTYTSEVDRDNPVGATFKQRIREGGRVSEYDGEWVAYARPNHIGVTIGSGSFQFQTDYRFSSTPSGTRLDYSADVVASTWWVRILSLLMNWFTKRILVKQMTKLKEVAESRAGEEAAEV